MTRINLLPPEIKEKAERPRILPWVLLMVVATIAVVVVIFLVFSGQKGSKEETLRQKQQELEELQKQTKGIVVYQQQEQELRALEGLYARANAGRVAWAQMLNDLAMYVPEGLATASNPRAPAIWLTSLSIDAQSLETMAGAPGGAAQVTGATPINIEGFATPAWLCIQTWLPRASDFKAKGFLDAYPYYYYFRGHPKVAEFFVRLHNMEEWSNLWITQSSQENITESRLVIGDNAEVTEEDYSDWAIHFSITAQWNAEKAIWQGAADQAMAPTGGS